MNFWVNRSLELSTGQVGGWWEREGSEYTDKSRVILGNFEKLGKKISGGGFFQTGRGKPLFWALCRCI